MLMLRHRLQATLLRAGGSGHGVPLPPPLLRDERSSSVICHVSPSSAGAGQGVITLRSLYELYNGLPSDIHLRLTNPGAHRLILPTLFHFQI